LARLPVSRIGVPREVQEIALSKGMVPYLPGAQDAMEG